jgi:hypothetical protein
MNIIVSYDSTVTSQSAAFQAQFKAAVNAAVGFLDHAFTENVTAYVTMQWAPLTSLVAHNNFFTRFYDYTTVVNALKTSGHSADDAAGYGTLPASDPAGSGNTWVLTDPQAIALGLYSATPPAVTVTLNSNDLFTFDPDNRAVSGEHDAVGAIEHEISEGVFGRFASVGSSAGLGVGKYTPLDLFRYSAPGVRDFSTNTADYFSINGNQLLTEFNINSVNGGDIGDWYPSIRGDSFGDNYTGTVTAITPTDLRELDVLGWTRAAAPRADLNSDFVSDVVWRDNSNGDTGYWAVNGGVANWHDFGVTSTAYSMVGTGDFDANYTSDILWRNSSNGDTGYWAISNDAAAWHDYGITSTAYSVVGVGEFTGDGASDILWRNNSDGDTGYWRITNNGNTATWHDYGITDSAYSVVGVGDLNGDGRSDVLWRNNANGDTGYWGITNSGNTASWHDYGVTSTAYSVGGIGDFNGDNTSDVLWRNNSTGDTGYWGISNSGNTAAWHDFGITDPSYIVAGTGDYNGDGTADVLWRNNATGDTGYWGITNSGNTVAWHDFGTTSTTYNVQNV